MLDHADECEGHSTFTKCESHCTGHGPDGTPQIAVVRIEWCGDCTAANYRRV